MQPAQLLLVDTIGWHDINGISQRSEVNTVFYGFFRYAGANRVQVPVLTGFHFKSQDRSKLTDILYCERGVIIAKLEKYCCILLGDPSDILHAFLFFKQIQTCQSSRTGDWICRERMAVKKISQNDPHSPASMPALAGFDEFVLDNFHDYKGKKLNARMN